jgi:hypothetical protein
VLLLVWEAHPFFLNRLREGGGATGVDDDRGWVLCTGIADDSGRYLCGPSRQWQIAAICRPEVGGGAADRRLGPARPSMGRRLEPLPDLRQPEGEEDSPTSSTSGGGSFSRPPAAGGYGGGSVGVLDRQPTKGSTRSR